MGLQFPSRFWAAMKDGPAGVGTILGARYFNPIFKLIDTRLGALEDLRVDWIKATEELIAFGLQRIDTVLGPAFARVGRIASLGFLIGHSTTSETLVVGEVSTFVISDEDERELFHPSAWVTLTKPDSESDFALARVLSYVRETGVLDTEIVQVVGSPGPHADWEITSGSGVTQYVARVIQIVQGFRAQVVAKGSVSSGTAQFDVGAASVQTITVAGAHNWSFVGWDSSYSLIEIIATNAGSAALTLPTILWLKGDGGTSSSFADMNVELQAVGVNHFLIWSPDGGVTKFGVAR